MSYARLMSWGLAVAAILVSVTFTVASNRNGLYVGRTCVENTGGYVDPRNGDGPECNKYALEANKETLIQSAFRGVGQGIVPAVFLSIVGLYIGDVLDKRRQKEPVHGEHLSR